MKVIVLTFKSLCNWRMFFFLLLSHTGRGKKRMGEKKIEKTTQRKQVQLSFCKVEKQEDGRVELTLDVVVCC